ncbi:MAG TPA: hypothetical protein DEA46_06175 [Candidatus Moranbacteria bacterium]|nr:hypothetical protein [Candidatus Moranbacteria bacterium]
MEKIINMTALEALFKGETLDEIKHTIDQFNQDVETAITKLQRIESTDRNILRGVVQDMLAEGQEEKNLFLERLVLDLQPKHKNFPLLLASIKARIPVWIYGDTGSGKTTATELAAKSIGLPFRFISVCPTTNKSELFGYNDANGKYHSTAFREIFENGGVFLIDEIDNGNPSVLSVLNTSLANDQCSFPDGNIKRHLDAIFVAAANTIGRGADIRYVGRNALDATTLDRFVYVRMDIDENLEQALIGRAWDDAMLIDIDDDEKIDIDEWYEFVTNVRSVCQKLGINHIVSPRATIYGQRLIQVGLGKTNLREMCVWKGIRKTDREKIEENLVEDSIEPPPSPGNFDEDEVPF